MFILIRQGGYFAHTEMITLDEIDRPVFDAAIKPLVEGGWEIAGLHRSETVGKLTVILKRERQQFL